MATLYDVTITNGTGTADEAIPSGQYDISLGGTNLAYGTTLYSDSSLSTIAYDTTVTDGDQVFNYYVGATGAATIRLVLTAGGPKITGTKTDGVKVRRRVSVSGATKYAGAILELASAEATVSTLPFISGGLGPDITFEIDEDDLKSKGYALVTEGQNTVTLPIQSATATGTIFEFVVVETNKTVNIADGNAGLSDNFADAPSTTSFYGIEEGTFNFDEYTPEP